MKKHLTLKLCVTLCFTFSALPTTVDLKMTYKFFETYNLG